MQERTGIDAESLEHVNDQGLDTLAERVGLLKAVGVFFAVQTRKF